MEKGRPRGSEGYRSRERRRRTPPPPTARSTAKAEGNEAVRHRKGKGWRRTRWNHLACTTRERLPRRSLHPKKRIDRFNPSPLLGEAAPSPPPVPFPSSHRCQRWSRPARIAVGCTVPIPPIPEKARRSTREANIAPNSPPLVGRWSGQTIQTPMGSSCGGVPP